MWNIIAVGLVFVIVAVGIVYAFVSFNGASQQQAGQDLTQETAQLITAITSAYGTVPNFSNLTASSASIDQYAPSSWTLSGSNFILPEGGTASIAPAGYGGGSDNAFSITFSDLNPGECTALAGFVVAQMSSLAVNGTTANNPAYNPGASGSQWPQNLTADCTSGSTNTVVTILVGQ